eukprot:gene19654-26340_t
MDSFQGYDVLMHDEWHPHTIQYELIKAGLKYPIKYSLNKQCYVAAFGDMCMTHMIDDTGGNALASEPRSHMCIVITHSVRGFNYEKAMFGHVTRDGRFMEGFFPFTFCFNAQTAQRSAIKELGRLTDQRYKVLGAKLNPLSSGLANIVMFVRFDQSCPFDRQLYSNRTRFVPTPLITKFNEPVKCLRVKIGFLQVDDALFDEAYNFMQNMGITVMGCRLRHIKMIRAKHEMHVMLHVEDEEAFLVDAEEKYKKAEAMIKNAFNRSCIFKCVEFEIVTTI